MPLVTVFTPTYNRATLLPRLFESLSKQTCLDFEWLIVDDGSIDETEQLVNTNFKAAETKFEIRYFKKENGGKHTAINRGLELAKGDLFFIVDSDDILTPDAIETIKKDYLSIKDNPKLCGIGYLRGYDSDKVIGDKYSNDRFISNFIDERYNRGVDGDKAEVWLTKYLKEFRYPEYKGEKFISESVAWVWLAERYDMLFVNKIIYITEYQKGGLSDKGRRLRFQCPHLMAYGSLISMTKKFSFKIRIRETLLYIVYSLFGHFGWKKIFNCQYKSLVFICAIPGWALYKLWKIKYKM